MRASIGIVLGVVSMALLSACDRKPETGAVAAAAIQPAPAANSPLPHRKAGLWRQTAELVGSPANPPPAESCSDADSEAKLNLLGQHRNKDICQQQDFTRNPDGSIGFKIKCDLGPRVGTTVSTGLITGDFNARYQVAMEARTTGAPLPEMNADRKMTVTYTWIGPCAPGQRGGDVIKPDGTKFNLTDPHPRAGYR